MDKQAAIVQELQSLLATLEAQLTGNGQRITDANLAADDRAERGDHDLDTLTDTLTEIRERLARLENAYQLQREYGA